MADRDNYMEYVRITESDLEALKPLQIAYKREIGEEPPSEGELGRLREAIADQAILFYGCREGERLIACCSVSPIFSTFDYQRGGVFEDFYIVPECRHQGIARKLVRFAYEQSGAGSLTVGCADCDVDMYHSLGFSIRLGNMYAYEA